MNKSSLPVIVGLLVLASEPCRAFQSTGPALHGAGHPTCSAPRNTALFSATQNYTFGIDSFLSQQEQQYQEEIRRHERPEEQRWREARRVAEEARLQGQHLRGGHNERWLAERQAYQSYHASPRSSNAGFEGSFDSQEEELRRLKAEYSRKLAEEARQQGEILDGGMFENSQRATRLQDQQRETREAEEALRRAEELRAAEQTAHHARMAARQQREAQTRQWQENLNPGSSGVLINGGGFFSSDLQGNGRRRPMTPEEMEALEEERRRAEAARIAHELQIEHEIKTQRLLEEIEYCQKLSLDELKQEVKERGIEGRFYERWEYVLAVARARDAEGYVEVSEVEVLADDEVIAEANKNSVHPKAFSRSQSPPTATGGRQAFQQMPPINPPYSYSSNQKRSAKWDSYSYTYPSSGPRNAPGNSFGYDYSDPVANQRHAAPKYEPPYPTPAPTVPYTQSAFHSPYTHQSTPKETTKQQSQSDMGSSGFTAAQADQNQPGSTFTSPFHEIGKVESSQSQKRSSLYDNKSKGAQPNHSNVPSGTVAAPRQEHAFNSPITEGKQGVSSVRNPGNNHPQSARQGIIGTGHPVHPYDPRFDDSLRKQSPSNTVEGQSANVCKTTNNGHVRQVIPESDNSGRRCHFVTYEDE